MILQLIKLIITHCEGKVKMNRENIFEQLKIENQTLNEKIEERNEELHKLKKKITCTVVILSHTREKL